MTDDTQSRNVKPDIRCPCCEEIFDSKRLASHRLDRNKFGIDIFACPLCSERIKIDPYEYSAMSAIIAQGDFARAADDPGRVAIGAYKVDEPMPCEKEARKEMGWLSRLFRR
jgi:hypothetical protein